MSMLGCVTPALVVLLAALGVSGSMGWLDYMLMPAMAVFAGLTGYAILCRFRRRQVKPEGLKQSAPLALGLAGCGCFFVVVLTHVAERFHLLPSMGWGMPNSPGHYLDLFSAITAVVFLVAAFALRWISN